MFLFIVQFYMFDIHFENSSLSSNRYSYHCPSAHLRKKDPSQSWLSQDSVCVPVKGSLWAKVHLQVSSWRHNLFIASAFVATNFKCIDKSTSAGEKGVVCKVMEKYIILNIIWRLLYANPVYIVSRKLFYHFVK